MNLQKKITLMKNLIQLLPSISRPGLNYVIWFIVKLILDWTKSNILLLNFWTYREGQGIDILKKNLLHHKQNIIYCSYLMNKNNP